MSSFLKILFFATFFASCYASDTVFSGFTRDQINDWIVGLPHITNINLSDQTEAPSTGERLKKYPFFENNETILQLSPSSPNNNLYDFLYDFNLISSFLDDVHTVFDEHINISQIEEKKQKTTFIRKAEKFDTNTTFHLFGDLHGGIHNIWSILQGTIDNNLQIIDKKNHYFFLGDITDSGPHSYETLMLLLIMYMKNKSNIHLIRGNHEDERTNKTYGFWKELEVNFSNSHEKLKKTITDIYTLLPSVFFAVIPETRQIKILCHGMIDPGDQTDVKKMLNTFCTADETQKSTLPFTQKNDTACRYNWNDCHTDPDAETQESSRGAGQVIGQTAVKDYLNDILPNGYTGEIYRGHQHVFDFFSGLMPCFFLNNYMAYLWNINKPIVFTLPFSPDSAGGMPFNDPSIFPGIARLSYITIENGGNAVTVITRKNTFYNQVVQDTHYQSLLQNIKQLFTGIDYLQQFLHKKNVTIKDCFDDHYKTIDTDIDELYRNKNSLGKLLFDLFVKVKDSKTVSSEENNMLILLNPILEYLSGNAESPKESFKQDSDKTLKFKITTCLTYLAPYFVTLKLQWHKRLQEKLPFRNHNDITLKMVKELFSIEQDGVVAEYVYHNKELKDLHEILNEERRKKIRNFIGIGVTLFAAFGILGNLIAKKKFSLKLPSWLPSFGVPKVFSRFFFKKLENK
jgi:hypothetical protein